MNSKIKTPNLYIGAIVLDIETSSADIDTAALRMWGIYDISAQRCNFGVSIYALQEEINKAQYLIGYNIKQFDIPIIQRLGIKIPRHIIIIDCYEILAPRPLRPDDPPGKGRAAIIGELRLDGLMDNRFPNLKLGTVVSHLGKIFEGRYSFTNKKGEFDYKKLQGPLTPTDFAELKVYLEGDLKATADVFHFLDDYFAGFKDYLSADDNARLIHITGSTASIAYKAICNRIGLPEEYGEKDRDNFDGAFVIEPAGETFSGDGYVLDFNSQHPNHQLSANLYSPASQKEITEGRYYSGDGKIFKLNGKYSIAKQGPVEKLLLEWFMLRKQYKKANDPREYTLKILLNSSYGLSSSAVFASLYYEHTGPDTTLMSKQSSAFMKKLFEQNGYKVIAGDTDSLFVMDPFKDKAKLLIIKDDGIRQLKAALPFAGDTYNMGIDAEFSHIFFFKNPLYNPNAPKIEMVNEYLKKTYIYISKSGKIKIKGGPLIKSDATRLGKHVFKKYILPRILQEHSAAFEKDWIRRSIETEIRNDISLVARGIACKPKSFYKNPNQLQAALSERYGEGVHMVVKNSHVGVGADKSKYCSVAEARTLPLSAIDLDKTWNELGLFVKEETKQENLAGWL